MSSMATPEVVNLISPSQLGVGELIIYEFVADGQWRWSMGTITSLSTATADLDGGEVTCPPSAGWVVGVRDWTIAPSNVPATAPPPSSAERTSKAKAAAASGDPTPVGQDAFSGTTIKESTVLEIAWDMLDNSKAEEWETLLRLPLSELHRASRTAVILVLQLMGQLPLNRSFEQCWTDNGDTHATAATQWKKAVACLLQPEFSDELARFTLLQNPSHANGPATAAPAKLRQRRVDAVRNAILRERNFTYKAAQSASELTGRLYKWLVGQIRLFDAAAKRRANRSSSSRQGGGLDLNKTTMFFEESDATTSTLRSAIICVLELSTSIHDQRRVGISKAHLARIHSLAFQQRRAVGAGDGKETLIQMSEDYEKVIDVLRLSLRSKHDGRIRAAEELRSAWNAAQASREACNRTVEQLLRSIETASEYLTCDDGEVSRAPSCVGLSRPETVNPSIYSQSSRITSGARLATVTHKLNPYARRSCASTSIGEGEEPTMGPRGLPPAFVGNQREGSRSSWLAGTTGAAAGRVSRSAPSTLDSCDLTAVEDMHQRMVLRLQRAVAELDCTVEGLDTQIEALESAGMPDDDSNRAKKLAIVQKQRDSVRQDRDDKAKQLQQLELLLDAVRRIAISA